MINANKIVGSHDLLLVTLDTLRFDVAERCLTEGRLPNLGPLIPQHHWERRHSPGSFTYSAHHAFFAGFLPTPIAPGVYPRLFAARFEGSETTTPKTYVYDSATWIEALSNEGYHTVCIGGVGFFSGQSALTKALPSLFDASYWSPEMSATSNTSTEHQVALACRVIDEMSPNQRLLLFINVSSIHQPNCIFSANTEEDSPGTQAAALEYVDRCLPPLFDALKKRGPSFCIVCSDHGTAYGEEGYQGHRLAHPVVWTVPYAEFFLSEHAGSQR